MLKVFIGVEYILDYTTWTVVSFSNTSSNNSRAAIGLVAARHARHCHCAVVRLCYGIPK
jgi:hypothetical protein